MLYSNLAVRPSHDASCASILPFSLPQGIREIELVDDLRQLTYYSIETDDKILLRW